MAADNLISDVAPSWCKPGVEVEFKNPEMHPAAMRDDIHTFIITEPKERDNVGIVRRDEWCKDQMCEDATERIVSYLELEIYKKREEVIIGELNEEVDRIKSQVGMKRFLSGRYLQSADLFKKLSVSDSLVEFLTLSAYEHIK